MHLRYPGGHRLPLITERTKDDEVDTLGHARSRHAQSNHCPPRRRRLQQESEEVVVRPEPIPHIAESYTESRQSNSRRRRPDPSRRHVRHCLSPRLLPPRRQTAELFQNPPAHIHQPLHTSGNDGLPCHLLKSGPSGADIIVRVKPTKLTQHDAIMHYRNAHPHRIQHILTDRREP